LTPAHSDITSHATGKLKTESVEDAAAYGILDNGEERDTAYICVVQVGSESTSSCESNNLTT
jgi:hypothetical protein